MNTNPTKNVTTHELAAIVHALPLGQKVSVLMKRSADGDMLKKHRETKAANPWLGKLTKQTYIVGTGGGVPKHEDNKLAATSDDAVSDGSSYQRAVNRQRVAAGDDANFESGEDKVNTRIGHTPLMQAKRDGTLKIDLMPDWSSTRSRYAFANGSGVSRDTLRPYLSASVLKRGDAPPATLRPALDKIVEARIGGVIYKVASPKRVTFADVAAIVGQPSTKAATN